jgi:hypothetical protein
MIAIGSLSNGAKRLTTPSRPPGYRSPSDLAAAAKIPASRATRVARQRSGECVWPAMAGVPSSFELYAFATLRGGLSAAAGALDALLLAQACRSLARAHQAHELLAREGLVVADNEGNVLPHPAVKIGTAFAGLASRQLAALGLASVLLDRAPPIAGLEERERGGVVDEHGVLHPADGSPARYVGTGAKVLPLKRRRRR